VIEPNNTSTGLELLDCDDEIYLRDTSTNLRSDRILESKSPTGAPEIRWNDSAAGKTVSVSEMN